MYQETPQKITGKLKELTTGHPLKIFYGIGLIALVFVVTLVASTSKAHTISIEEIEENSAKYTELQFEVDECAAVISEAQKEQAELSHRNDLLRELFSTGENQ